MCSIVRYALEFRSERINLDRQQVVLKRLSHLNYFSDRHQETCRLKKRV